MRWLLVGLVVLGVGCKDKPTPTPTPTGFAPPTLAGSRSAIQSSEPPTPRPTPTPPTPWDAGKSACVQQAGAISPRAGFRDGTVAQTAKHTYTLHDDGLLEIADKGAAVGKKLANARPGTRIAAAQFGEHEIVTFLGNKKTSEGIMTQAFASIDGEAPARISEDGAGATTVDVAPRGRAAVVGYIDARSAMAPVHARIVSDKDGKAEVGKDAVVFVGGAPDPHVSGVLATSPDAAYFVLPIARDTTTFGMAIIQIDDPPREDAPVTWSMYPYGLDPAPITASRDVVPIHVARVVPRAGGPRAPRGIELGQILPGGAFRSLGMVVEQSEARYVGLDIDPSAPRAPKLKYGDADTLTSLTLACPP